jgi:hypothetical protein
MAVADDLRHRGRHGGDPVFLGFDLFQDSDDHR